MRELSMHILDLTQNSIVAGASRIEISVELDTIADMLKISIGDNGKGMSPDFLKAVRDPFTTTRTTRRVGLGIPMMTESAQMCGGDLDLSSKVGEGTKLSATFRMSHIDRAPLGDIPGTLTVLIAANPEISFNYTQRVDDKEFVLDTDEIKAQLDDVPINELSVLKWISEYVKEGTSGELEIN